MRSVYFPPFQGGGTGSNPLGCDGNSPKSQQYKLLECPLLTVSVRECPPFGAQLVLASARGTLHSLRSRKADSTMRALVVSRACARDQNVSQSQSAQSLFGHVAVPFGSGDHDLANVDVEFAQTLGEDAHEF